MREFVTKTIVCAIAVSIAAWWIDGIQLGAPGDSWATRLATAAAVGAILAALNTAVKPVLTFLSIPFLIATLGLFWFVLGAAMLWLTSRLAGAFHVAFHVDNFWWQSILGALVITLISLVTEPLFARDDRRKKRRKFTTSRKHHI